MHRTIEQIDHPHTLFSLLAPKTLNYLAFQSFDLERT
jgi:hypothetical protein